MSVMTVEFLRNSSADCFTTTDRRQLKTHSPEGPTNGQRRFNQEEEGDGGDNGEATATNTASQSWKPAFPQFREP